MKNIGDVIRALILTKDGLNVLLWLPVFLALLVRSVLFHGFEFEQIKYIFYIFVLLAIFVRFRVGSFDDEMKTNFWGMANINGFGFLILYMECYRE